MLMQKAENILTHALQSSFFLLQFHNAYKYLFYYISKYLSDRYSITQQQILKQLLLFCRDS